MELEQSLNFSNTRIFMNTSNGHVAASQSDSATDSSAEENVFHQTNVRNVIIIGSGPAGFTAALYTARANLKPLLIAGSIDPLTSRIKGGQLMATSDIENFPGAIEDPAAEVEDVKGITGPELMHRMEIQARHFGTEMLEEFVTEVHLDSSGVHTVKTEGGQEFRTHALIIATGAAAKRLGIEAEEKFFGQGGGVSTCATCDGASFARAGATVAVVGGGDSAMEEASYLARLDGIPKVHVIHRRDEFRASKIMLKRVQENPKIEVHTFAVVKDLIGKPHPLGEKIAFYKDKEVLDKAVLEDPRSGETKELHVEGLFVAIGHTPNTQLFTEQLQTDDEGYLQRDGKSRALSVSGEWVPGVFVAGDVADHVYRQAITAAGEGCRAAIEAERYLAECVAEQLGVDPEDAALNVETIAQEHWNKAGDMDQQKSVVERVEEAAEV